MTAEKWEYLTLSIHYDGKKHKDWILEYAEKPPLVGLEEILRTYGAHGWELVSLNPDSLHAFPGFGTWNVETRAYRATFKRPARG